MVGKLTIKRRVEVPVAPQVVPTSPQGSVGGAPVKPANDFPEGKYLLKVESIEDVPLTAEEKHGGLRVRMTIITPPAFANRKLTARLFPHSKTEEAFAVAVGREGEIDPEVVKGLLVWGFTVNKPRKDKTGTYVVVADFRPFTAGETEAKIPMSVKEIANG